MAGKRKKNVVVSLDAKRKKRSQSKATKSAVASHGGPIVPLDPVERYAWDRVWDWFIETTRPYVLAYAQEEEEAAQRKAA